MNRVEVSPDGMDMVIVGPDGHRATLRSARPGGFIAEDVEKAHTFELNIRMLPNQVNRARRIQLGSRVVYAHCNVGPPTWWLPRLEIKRGKVMAGWLRLLVAVSWPVPTEAQEADK